MTTQVHSLWLPYAQMKTVPPPYRVIRAEGVKLYLDDGTVLIDGISSWWCVIHGYNHPVLNQAVQEQLAKFAHVMLGGLVNDAAIHLAETLVRITPDRLNHVFFGDSGSVGVEVALKMAIQFWRNKGVSQKSHFVALRRGYHGDTTGAMSVSDDDEGMHRLFKGVILPQYFVDAPGGVNIESHECQTSLCQLAELLKSNKNQIAAVILEPIFQGAGGFRFYPPEYLFHVRRLCDEHGVLLIFDEVATGFGRTGALFAADLANVTPDIMVLGKALTGGYFGLSATIATSQVYESFLGDDPELAFMHGPTFMGHAIACAVALASINLIETENYLSKVKAIEQVLKEELQGLEGRSLCDARVLGAIGVLEFECPSNLTGFREFALDRGVWLRPYSKWLYTMPPYIIGEDNLRRITAVMKEWVKYLSHQGKHI
ncbi:adenosylmethionine--8-amino-7-oxononanoate transaminase [Scytonema sp. UIC 10036]|uniref:adenosylmethionine--8-amino-7-oxononanoate transaminase n=1 Tax=Scytonema sp. UIC 10036 TaxID=2304196 RepID=UPI0012DA4649|nr:adenosylmethionine--8-amino-7-oxononanoate transaminase [Scytonema sp. UIC 10036]MUG98145.1 adenosylmethionine--8-amino-7-oxononanoate transaminase [Scytonema sp. UIC 10036]